MRFLPSLLVFSVIFGVTPLFATSQVYRYTDASGTPTFTNDLQSIPEPYRRLAVPLFSEMTSQAGSIAPEPPQVHQDPMTHVVTVSSDYRMGAYDTPAAAVRMAIQSAKRQALEQVATYLESVTEIKHLDVTRDELRAYSAGSVIVLDQQTSTKTQDGAVVLHVDLTAQVDRKEAIQGITALRDNDSAKQELASLRLETDRLRQQLDAANDALATAQSQEAIQARLAERQRLLDQMEADSLRTAAISTTRIVSVYPMIGGLIFQPTPLQPQPPLSALQPPTPPAPASGDFPSAADQNRLKEAVTQPTQPLIPAFPQIQPLGVPHGSLTQAPGLSPQAAQPVQPTSPRIQPLGVPHGSLTQIPSTSPFFSGPTGGQGR
jgi:hypothetical protein